MSHFVKLGENRWINREPVSEVIVGATGDGKAWRINYFVPEMEDPVAYELHPNKEAAHAAVERFLKD